MAACARGVLDVDGHSRKSDWAVAKRNILFYCLFLGLTGSAFSYQASFFKRFDTRDGLIQYSVSTIVQDDTGFMWFGTESGISRFDGNAFTSFASMNGFTYDAVITLIPSGSRVFALSSRGELYRQHLNRMQKVSFPDRIRFGFDGDEGDIWLITAEETRSLSGGVIFPNPFSQWDMTGERPACSRFLGNRLLAVGESLFAFDPEEGYRHVGDFGQPVQALCPAADDMLALVFPHDVQVLNADFEVTMEIPSSEAWEFTCATSCDQGLFLGTSHGEIWTADRTGSLRRFARSGSENALMTLFCDYERNLWAGLDSGGLLLFPRAQFKSWTAAEGVGSGDVFFVVADAVRGGVWAGTRNGGIAHIDPLDRVTPLGVEQGLQSNRVRSMMQSSDGTLWVGTDTGISAITTDGEVQTISAVKDRGCRCLGEFPGFGVVAGSQDGTLFQLDGDRQLAHERCQLPVEAQIRDLLADGDTLWVASSRGLFRWQGGQLTSIPEFQFERINRLVRFNASTLILVSENKGIWEHHADRWTRIGEQVIGDRLMLSAVMAPDQSCWFGSDQGVLILEQDGMWSILDARHGLKSEIIFLIGFDVKGDAWVGGVSGLSHVTARQVVAHYDYRDGLADNELNGFGFVNDALGRAWFCTMRGISCVDPDALKAQTVIPRIAMTGIDINNAPMVLQITSGQEPDEPLVLENRQNNLRFRFSALSFTNPSRVEYSCRLEGFDADWTPAHSERSASYPKLPPGHFIFHVKAHAGDQRWSEPVSTSFRIQYALYQRSWFKILLVLLGVLFIYALINLRTRSVQRRNQQLEVLVAERTQELESLNEELRLLSSVDPLTGLYNRRFFEQKIKEDIAFCVRQHLRQPDERKRKAPLTFFMIDIDFFKKLNDTEGHESGDQVLREIGLRFRETIRASDIIARWGGEEFLLLSKENDFEDAMILAERLRRAASDLPFSLKNGPITKTVSLGFCPFPPLPNTPDLISWEEAVQIADQALYLSKHRGRNRWTGIKVKREYLDPEQVSILLRDLSRARELGLVEIVEPEHHA